MVEWDRATGLDGAVVYNNDIQDEDCHFKERDCSIMVFAVRLSFQARNSGNGAS